MNPGDGFGNGSADDRDHRPPGRRSGAGSASILPYLMESLRSKVPQAPAVGQGQPAQPPSGEHRSAG